MEGIECDIGLTFLVGRLSRCTACWKGTKMTLGSRFQITSCPRSKKNSKTAEV